jgi:hypothetical protein
MDARLRPPAGETVMIRDSGEWTVAASFPVPGDVTGRYTPLLWLRDR